MRQVRRFTAPTCSARYSALPAASSTPTQARCRFWACLPSRGGESCRGQPVVLGPPATAPWRPVRRSTGPSVSRPGFAVCAGGTRFAPKSSRAPTCKCQFPHRDAKSHVSAESGPVVNQSIDEAAGRAARPDRTTHRCTETPVNEPQQEAARVKEKGGLQEHVSAFVVVLEIQ